MRLAPAALALTLLMAGACGRGVGLAPEAELEVESGAEALTFAALTDCYEPGATSDVVVSRPERGQVDLVAQDEARWSRIGSFYAGPLPPAQIIRADVGGRPVVLARLQDDEVMLLSGDLGRAHHLRSPVEVFEGEAVTTIAAGELDKDGSAELLVVNGDDVTLVDDLERALFANPEEPPELPADDIPGDEAAGDVAVVDATGDGLPDVVSILPDATKVRIHHSPGLDRERPRDHWDVELPAEGRALLPLRCGDGGGAVLLEDGTVARLRPGEDEASRMDGLDGIEHEVGRRDAAVFAGEQGALTLTDGCLQRRGRLRLRQGGPIRAMALGVRTGGTRRFAVLESDGATVRIFRVTGDL